MFDVYVDGATETSREAVRELASAMAARYRLPAVELEARLTRGRFRVKAGVDRATAEVYLRDLAAIGARVRIVPAGEPAVDAPGRSPPPEPRPARSSLPPQSESGRARSSLPPQPESQPARSSLTPQPESGAARSSLPPQPESRPARSSLPPQPEPRPARSSLPPQLGPRSTSSQSPPAEDLLLTLLPQVTGWPPAGSSGSPAESGAVTPTGPIATLGALDRSGALSLVTLDDELASVPSTDGTLPASMGPAAPRPPRPARSRNEPVDPFAPPELAADEPLLVLADDDLAHRARKQASVPPAMASDPARPATPSTPPVGPQRALPSPPGGSGLATAASARGADPALHGSNGQPGGGPHGVAPVSPGALGGGPHSVLPVSPGAPGGGPHNLASAPSAPRMPLNPPGLSDAPPSAFMTAARRLGSELMARVPVLASARVRLVAGVALAIALGFVPAHLVAGMRERSAFAAIDAKVAAVQSTADTPDSYAALDPFRAEQLDAKYSARRSIAVTSLLVWAAVGAALAYGWFSLFRPPPKAPRPVPTSPGGLRDPLGG